MNLNAESNQEKKKLHTTKCTSVNGTSTSGEYIFCDKLEHILITKEYFEKIFDRMLLSQMGLIIPFYIFSEIFAIL